MRNQSTLRCGRTIEDFPQTRRNLGIKRQYSTDDHHALTQRNSMLTNVYHALNYNARGPVAGYIE